MRATSDSCKAAASSSILRQLLVCGTSRTFRAGMGFAPEWLIWAPCVTVAH